MPSAALYCSLFICEALTQTSATRNRHKQVRLGKAIGKAILTNWSTIPLTLLQSQLLK